MLREFLNQLGVSAGVHASGASGAGGRGALSGSPVAGTAALGTPGLMPVPAGSLHPLVQALLVSPNGFQTAS